MFLLGFPFSCRHLMNHVLDPFPMVGLLLFFFPRPTYRDGRGRKKKKLLTARCLCRQGQPEAVTCVVVRTYIRPYNVRRPINTKLPTRLTPDARQMPCVFSDLSVRQTSSNHHQMATTLRLISFEFETSLLVRESTATSFQVSHFGHRSLDMNMPAQLVVESLPLCYSWSEWELRAKSCPTTFSLQIEL